MKLAKGCFFGRDVIAIVLVFRRFAGQSKKSVAKKYNSQPNALDENISGWKYSGNSRLCFCFELVEMSRQKN